MKSIQECVIGTMIALLLVIAFSFNGIMDLFKVASRRQLIDLAKHSYDDARETLKGLGISTYSAKEATGRRVLEDDPTLKALLRSAIDEPSRRRLAEHIVLKQGCRYCDAQTLTLDDKANSQDFQKWYNNKEALLLYDAIKHWPAYSNWTESFFQSTDVGERELKIIVDDDDMQFLRNAQLTGKDLGGPIEEVGEKMALREFVKKCVAGDASHRFVFHPIAGGNANFREWHKAWMPNYVDDTGVVNAHPDILKRLSMQY